MDEGIEMKHIEQTSSEPQFPWWVSKVSTGDDKILASFKAGAADNASTPLALVNAEAEFFNKPSSS